MERQGIHELSAAYALHALDHADERVYEEHLARCDECREEVASFDQTVALMAYDVDAPEPPAALKSRILERARAERPNVVSFRERRRWVFPVTAGLAAAAAAVALAFGLWAASLSSRLDEARADRAEVVPLTGANGSVVLMKDGQAALLLAGVEAAPEGKTYEAWVIEDGTARRAGLFAGGGRTAIVLTRPVPEGAVVAVTLERAGGVDRPTGKPLFTATT